MTFHIVFALYPGVTQLDFTGPLQVFGRLPGVTVTLATSAGGALDADGLPLAGLARLADIAGCDLVCVPGGAGVTDVFADADFLRELARLGRDARYVTSVCTGSLLLAAAGLLAGRRAACHWAWRDLLARFPGVTADPGRVVRDGNVFTGGGVTAGIDFALTVAAEVFGAEVAQATQLTLEYAPAPPFDAGSPESAPPSVRELVTTRLTRATPERVAAVDAMIQRMQPA